MCTMIYLHLQNLRFSLVRSHLEEFLFSSLYKVYIALHLCPDHGECTVGVS